MYAPPHPVSYTLRICGEGGESGTHSASLSVRPAAVDGAHPPGKKYHITPPKYVGAFIDRHLQLPRRTFAQQSGVASFGACIVYRLA